MNVGRLSKIVSVFIGIAIGLFVGELACRIFYFGLDGISLNKVNSFVPLSVTGNIKSADNYKVLYELKPNIDSYFKLKKFTTNTHGLRDKEYSISKSRNTIRGVVLGDSFTMGSGVDIEDVFHSIIEKYLNQSVNKYNYEVLNFGVSGYNLLNYLGVLETKILKYDPDFILIGFCGNNDFKVPNKKHLAGNYTVKENVNSQSYLKTLLFNLFDLERKSKNKRKSNQVSKQNIFMDEMLEEFKKFETKHDIPIIINYLSFSNANKTFAVIKDLAEKHDLLFADLSENFDKVNLRQYYINKRLYNFSLLLPH